MFDINEFRTLLKFEGISLDDYTDEELSILINSKINELKGLTEIDIRPTHRRQVNRNFNGDSLRLDFYPVYDLAEITLNHCPIHGFHVDSDLGIVYFKGNVRGDIEVKYLSGISDDVLNSSIIPLVREMVIYSLTYNKAGVGDAVSSIKEGDVSINYDTNNGRGSRINSRIADLKSRYSSARLRWL